MSKRQPLLLGIWNLCLYRGYSGYLGFVSRLSIGLFPVRQSALWRVVFFLIYKEVAQLEKVRGLKTQLILLYGILLCLSPLLKLIE